MKIADASGGAHAIRVVWTDGTVAEYPFIWLRDNDPADLHPHTRERTFDLTSVDLDIAPVSFEVNPGELLVQWPQQSQSSSYPAVWLHEHRPGHSRHDPSVVERTLWNRTAENSLPRVSAVTCAESPPALLEALLLAKRYGIVIVESLADSPDAAAEFGDLIGFRRETNFGIVFDVINKADPNNLAYTAMGLPLHTDLPNQELIPGYQFLHSLRNDASGGESVFADGFRLCADLRDEQPQDYELLQRVRLPWRFHDADYDIRRHRPLISHDDEDVIDCFVFNAHIADIPDLDARSLREFYAAYRRLMVRVRDPKYAVQHRLAPGEMVVFDNRRVLHGRKPFDPRSGGRHLRGYYMEHNEIDSRIRVLSREVT